MKRSLAFFAALLIVAGSAISGIVIQRDLKTQLQWSRKCACAEVLEERSVLSPWNPEIILTEVKARVVEPLQNSRDGEIFTFFYPGGRLGTQEYWTTVSPSRDLIAPGKKILVFLSENSGLAKFFGQSGKWWLQSYAEIYSVQESQTHELIVVAANNGGAITQNTRLRDLSEQIRGLLKGGK